MIGDNEPPPDSCLAITRSTFNNLLKVFHPPDYAHYEANVRSSLSADLQRRVLVCCVPTANFAYALFDLLLQISHNL